MNLDPIRLLSLMAPILLAVHGATPASAGLVILGDESFGWIFERAHNAPLIVPEPTSQPAVAICAMTAAQLARRRLR